MNPVVTQALDAWGLVDAQVRLAAARENQVYRVDMAKTRYALRLHRPGYATTDELAAEVAWMAALAAGGLAVPAPVATPDGAMFQTIDGMHVDLLLWLPGQTLDLCLDTLQADQRARVLFDLGAQMALLHDISDQWAEAGLARPVWDTAGLVGDAPHWDRFWENPALHPAARDQLLRFRNHARATLAAKGATLDYGLIHADLVPGNVLYDGQALRLIDFNDGGWGFRLFDIATALWKHRKAADYAALQQALITGYHSRRPLDVTDLPLFLALRAASYVGWNISRMNEPGGAERNDRFIAGALSVCHA